MTDLGHMTAMAILRRRVEAQRVVIAGQDRIIAQLQAEVALLRERIRNTEPGRFRVDL